MNAELILLALLLIGLFGRSPIIATAACGLLIIKLISVDSLLVIMEERSLDIGLLFLTLAVLVPFASEKIKWKDLKPLFTTWYGVVSLIGGAAATYLNGRGLHLLQMDPELMIGLVLGSVFGIVFLKGMPVGPLMAAGITAILLKLFQWIF